MNKYSEQARRVLDRYENGVEEFPRHLLADMATEIDRLEAQLSERPCRNFDAEHSGGACRVCGFTLQSHVSRGDSK